MRATFSTVLLVAVLGGATTLSLFGSGCGSDGGASQFDAGDDATTDALGDGGTPDDVIGINESGPLGPFPDFPATPIIDAPDGGVAAPGNAPTLFGAPTQGAQTGGPCLIEPEIGSLYPNNWLRPRFKWIAAGGENLFELRLHVANQTSDLVVYTASTDWTMPKAMWDALRRHSADVDMTLSVRGGVLAGTMLTGEALGSTGGIGIAPVDAPGTIVYWTTSGGSSLKGFSVGDETVGPVLTPTQVQEKSTTCIGCHTSTPDGKYVGFSTIDNSWANAIASIEMGTVGAAPMFLGAGGKVAIERQEIGIGSFSKAHWAAGDRVEVVQHDPGGGAVLEWIDLEAANAATASGVIARNGDARQAGAPTWSHDGNTIVYVSTNHVCTGRLGDCVGGPGDNGAVSDLYSVPYNSRAGGTATAIPGASDPNLAEYYPVFSPDDRLLAFNRIANDLLVYNAPTAEVFVVPSAGGTATRIVANDPPACSGKTSPGVTNSWPKWAPSVAESKGRTYYWVVFSSTRSPAGNPQLYVSPVVVDAMGKVTTYHALYLWNQPAGENNHTPAWDFFKIPPPPPPK